MAARTSLDIRPAEERTTYERIVRQCVHMWVDHAIVRKLTFHQAIAGLAANLLDVELLRLWQTKASTRSRAILRLSRTRTMPTGRSSRPIW